MKRQLKADRKIDIYKRRSNTEAKRKSRIKKTLIALGLFLLLAIFIGEEFIGNTVGFIFTIMIFTVIFGIPVFFIIKVIRERKSNDFRNVILISTLFIAYQFFLGAYNLGLSPLIITFDVLYFLIGYAVLRKDKFHKQQMVFIKRIKDERARGLIE